MGLFRRVYDMSAVRMSTFIYNACSNASRCGHGGREATVRRCYELNDNVDNFARRYYEPMWRRTNSNKIVNEASYECIDRRNINTVTGVSPTRAGRCLIDYKSPRRYRYRQSWDSPSAKHLPDVGEILGQRLRHWSKMDPTSGAPPPTFMDSSGGSGEKVDEIRILASSSCPYDLKPSPANTNHLYNIYTMLDR